jgi:DNA-damage-inducible protein J
MICKRVEKKTALKDSEFALSQNTAGHDAWFRAKVREALDDLRPGVSHKKVKAHFAKQRSAALRKTKSNGS